MKTKSTNLTRTRLVVLVVLAALALSALVLSRGVRGRLSLPFRVETTEGRQEYLHALGWEIDPASEDVRETSVPEALDDMMTDYNAMQREQGFDLIPYLGKPVTVVTYTLSDGSPEAGALITLWICDGVVIAGDVHTPAMDGYMHGIIKE